jgi:hypothetical protein
MPLIIVPFIRSSTGCHRTDSGTPRRNPSRGEPLQVTDLIGSVWNSRGVGRSIWTDRVAQFWEFSFSKTVLSLERQQ